MILKASRTPTGRRYYVRTLSGRDRSEDATAYECSLLPGIHSDRKPDLISQKKAIEQFCIGAGKEIHIKTEDVGSGLNYRRHSFCRLMEMVERAEVAEVVIAHEDRLVRFGYEWFTFVKRMGPRSSS